MIVSSQASVSERESAATPITVEDTPVAFDAGSVRQQARGGG